MKDKERTGGTRRELPRVSPEKCAGCGNCARVCYRKAISFVQNDKAAIFSRRCAGLDDCGRCLAACDNGAIAPP